MQPGRFRFSMEVPTVIKSMTGYGRAIQTFEDLEITAEIRAVNNRYLDCTVKLPRLYAYAEDRIKQCVKAQVSRGKVDVYLTISHPGGDVAVSLNRPVVEGYLTAMGAMVSEYGVRDDISVSVLSRLPDVFLVEKPDEDEEARAAALTDAVVAALEQFNAMRTAEGAALAADVLARGETILGLVEQVEARSPQTVAEYRAKLLGKMQEVLASTSIDENRILTEAAIYADKVAVDEETVRLRSHLKQLRSMLAAGGPIGRKLDFLLQEMNRETNTIGSKCSDLEITEIVVEIKAELEKIREQIQNIE